MPIEAQMPKYTRPEVIAAGRLISGYPPYPYSLETLEAFRLANDWRFAHLAPMRQVRRELSVFAKRADRSAITAGRPKRLQSIRRKLRPGKLTLYKLQDIAGCRAIMPDMKSVEEVIASYRDGRSSFSVHRESPYIEAPKGNGYRSHHIILKVPSDDEWGHEKTVEVQVRTTLQHAWATAVEAVGLVRDEALKSGQGDPRWLRFFAIMAAEFAAEESAAVVPGVDPDRRARLAELRQVEASIDAITTLESYNRVIQHVATYSQSPGQAFLVRYDRATNEVRVLPNYMTGASAEEYFRAEQVNSGGDLVSVEVDRVSDLSAAYPNYFLDVQSFTNRLRGALGKPRAVSTDGKYSPAWLRQFLTGG